MPKVIPVYVVGEVKNPGLHNVPLNTTLIESILIAGGPLNARSNRSKVQLNRTLKNNFVKRENYNINYSRGNSKNTNPVLKENDIIYPQANGLAFSVSKKHKIPPSLKNIFKELDETMEDFKIPDHGDLTRWVSNEKILLLNSALTVEHGKSNSHIKLWEPITDNIIKLISDN